MMNTTCSRFTRIRYQCPVGKGFELAPMGALKKTFLANFGQGIAETVSVTSIEQLEDFFRTSLNTDIFVGGVAKVERAVVKVKANRGSGEIARSKEDLQFPVGPGVMFIDNDYPFGQEDNQFNVYVKAVAELETASYVYSPSSSAWIYGSENGEMFKGAGGQHYAIPVQDASDIARALKSLHRRLILVGFGQPLITKCGTVLIKSPVDVTLGSSNQPLFQRALLGDGLTQQKNPHIGHQKGNVFMFDSTLITDLTPEELIQVSKIERQLRESVEDSATEVRTTWINERAECVAIRNNISTKVAKDYLRTNLTKVSLLARADLIPGIQVKFEAGWIDVGELLENPSKFDGKSCADPLEPDYGGGVGVAKFYANKNEKPNINSKAHGGQIFFLHPDPSDVDLSGILNQGMGNPEINLTLAAGEDSAKCQPTIYKSISDVKVWEPTLTVVPEQLKSFPLAKLNQFLDWFNRCAEDTVSSVSLASVIHLATTVVARGARTTMNNHASLFLLLIAPTGFGKNYGKNAVARLLHKANIQHRISSEFHSKGGVYSALLLSPNIIFHLDEFGDKIKLGLRDGSLISGAFSYIKEVYSASGSVLPAPSYSTIGLSRQQAEAIRPIKSPCANFYCLTTPGQLWDAIDNASVEGGFLNRFVGIMAAGSEVLTNETPAFDPPEELVTHITEVRNHLVGLGNLAEQKFSSADIEPDSIDYSFDAESRLLLDEFKRKITKLYKDDEFMANMAARWRENAMRLALALSVFSDPKCQAIDVTLTKWCIDYVEFYGNQFAKSVLEHSRPKHEYGRVRRDFLLAFRRRPEGTPPSALGQSAPWKSVSARIRSEIIDDLMKSGLVAEVAKPNKGQRGPQGKVYVALAES